MPEFSPWARAKSRRFLVQALYQWQMSGGSVGGLREQYADMEGFKKADAEFFGEVLTAILDQAEQLDAQLAPFLSDRNIEQLDPVEHAVLRLGAYELTARIDVPWRVVLDEAIGNAKRFGADQSHKFVNAVLEKLAREVRGAEVAATSRR